MIATAAALLAVGWLLGIPELVALCVVALVGCVLAAATLLVRSGAIHVERRVRPQRVAVGTGNDVLLSIHNRGSRSTPAAVIEDEAGPAGGVALSLAPLRPAETVTAVYRLSPLPRGVHHIGPLAIRQEDPFGLVRRSRTVEGRSTVIVVPRSEQLASLPALPADEPDASRATSMPNAVDEEFATLRSYIPGDDIRRIHWPSTARTGTPMVRQFDHPWQRRVTVLIDRRDGADRDAFERAMVVAASLIDLAARSGETVRVLDSTGADSGPVVAAVERPVLMERLAVLEPLPGGAAHDLARLSTAGGGTGWFVVITATEAISQPHELNPRPGAEGHILVSTASSDFLADTAQGLTIGWDGTFPLAEVWDRALGVRRPG